MRRDSFTLVELLVVVAIIGVLATMLLPALNRVREEGRRMVCVSNLRQNYIGEAASRTDNNGAQPMPDGFKTCPADGCSGGTDTAGQFGCWPHGWSSHSNECIERHDLPCPGWGAAYALKYISTHRTFYCPSRKDGELFALKGPFFKWDYWGPGPAGVWGSQWVATSYTVWSLPQGSQQWGELLGFGKNWFQPSGRVSSMDLWPQYQGRWFWWQGGSDPVVHGRDQYDVLFHDGHVVRWHDVAGQVAQWGETLGGGAGLTSCMYSLVYPYVESAQ